MDIKTDLIIEAANLLEKQKKGYTLNTTKSNFGFTKTVVQVKTKEASQFLNRKKGYYITLDTNSEYTQNVTVKNNIALELKSAIVELMHLCKIEHAKKVLVVGLGNKQMVSDSLGPKVCDKILITRHIKEVIKEVREELNSISAIATGVLGTTGIETANIVKAVVAEVKPDLVMLIDTLSTVETKRIATSFQITNTGIVPGGGIGNHRTAINKNVLGVPLIVIGVPLVVYAYSMCREVIEKVTGNLKNFDEYESKLKRVASGMLGDLVVTIKDIDQVVEHCAEIIALSINMAINPNVNFDNFN